MKIKKKKAEVGRVEVGQRFKGRLILKEGQGRGLTEEIEKQLSSLRLVVGHKKSDSKNKESPTADHFIAQFITSSSLLPSFFPLGQLQDVNFYENLFHAVICKRASRYTIRKTCLMK